MKLKWKRTWNNKSYSFEVEYNFYSKINGDQLNMPRIYLEDEELINQIKSIHESKILNTLKRNEQVKKENENNDEKTRVRNHFRNICFRKKFHTIKDHIKYISEYYSIPEMKALEYVEEDLPFIKKQVGLK